MSITLLITRGPASRASLRSVELAQALVEAGEPIARVFFQGDGVLLCSRDVNDASDPHGASRLWQALIHDHALPATACSGSASRRQLPAADDLATGIELAGLGQLAGAMMDAPRLVSF